MLKNAWKEGAEEAEKGKEEQEIFTFCYWVYYMSRLLDASVSHQLWGEVPCVQHGFQGLSDQAGLSSWLHTFTQAGTPARMPSPPPPHFTPNPLPREAFSEGCLRFQTQSLYEECSTWLFLNLVGLCKSVYNETKKTGLMIIPEGTRGKWVGLMGQWQAKDAAMMETGLSSFFLDDLALWTGLLQKLSYPLQSRIPVPMV